MTTDERLDDLEKRIRHQSNMIDRILGVLEKLIVKSDHNFKAFSDEEKK